MTNSLIDIINKYSHEHTWYGTDKGTAHSYLETYEKLLGSKENDKLVLVEIGVSAGYSVQCWLEFFKRAKIYAIDIDWSLCAFNDWPKDRVVKIHGSSMDPAIVDFLEPIDVLVEDGSHVVEHQIATFKIFYPLMKPGSIYIIEDVPNLEDLVSQLSELTSNYEVYDLRHVKNRHDDVLVVIYK